MCAGFAAASRAAAPPDAGERPQPVDAGERAAGEPLGLVAEREALRFIALPQVLLGEGAALERGVAVRLHGAVSSLRAVASVRAAW